MASCSEQAYPSITVAHARQLLLFDDDAVALQYASEVSMAVSQRVMGEY